VERKVFAALLPAGSRWLDVGFYTWILPSAMFAAMTMCGFHATEILKSAMSGRKKALSLFGYAFSLLAAGWTASVWVPVIKPIYTVSFTLQAMGWSAAALAVLYTVTDIWRLRRGLALPVLFGQYALTAYMATHEPFRPALRQFSETVTGGLAARFAPQAAPFMAACAAAVVVGLILAARKRIDAKRG
jgi:predicted acyltransferase